MQIRESQNRKRSEKTQESQSRSPKSGNQVQAYTGTHTGKEIPDQECKPGMKSQESSARNPDTGIGGQVFKVRHSKPGIQTQDTPKQEFLTWGLWPGLHNHESNAKGLKRGFSTQQSKAKNSKSDIQSQHFKHLNQNQQPTGRMLRPEIQLQEAKPSCQSLKLYSRLQIHASRSSNTRPRIYIPDSKPKARCPSAGIQANASAIKNPEPAAQTHES